MPGEDSWPPTDGRPATASTDGRQPNGRDRLRRDALAAAGEAQALGRGGLDADTGGRDRQQVGDPRRHSVTVRADLRAFAEDGQVDMFDRAAALAHTPGGMATEDRGNRAAPTRVARREVAADEIGRANV